MNYDLTLHIGYPDWPKRPLPFETLDCLNAQRPAKMGKWEILGPFADEELDLQTPWITPSDTYTQVGTIVGFTEEWFELKLGLLACLTKRPVGWLTLLTPPGSRWTTEVPPGIDWSVQDSADWTHIADLIAGADLFFGCCSALHVLAVAVGTPVVLVEPNPHRHHPIFYPLGMDGPQVTVVKGNDHLPSFDARHTADAIEAALARRKEKD